MKRITNNQDGDFNLPEKPAENIIIWITLEQYEHLKDVRGFIETYQYSRCDPPQRNEWGRLETCYSNIRFFIKNLNRF